MAKKKVMLVLPPRDFDADIYWTMRRVFEGLGHEVGTTSVATGSVMADDGRFVPVDDTIHHIHRYMWDCYVFLGGEGAKLYFDDPHIKKLVEDVKFKTIAAEGTASAILALNDVFVRGKRATGDHRFAGMVIENGGEYTGAPLEVEEKIITLREPEYAEQFALAISQKLEN